MNTDHSQNGKNLAELIISNFTDLQFKPLFWNLSLTVRIMKSFVSVCKEYDHKI